MEKNWYGIDTGDREEITVGLWRTAGEPEDGDSEQVKNDSGQQMTIVLSADTDWKSVPSGIFRSTVKREISISIMPAK